MEKKTAMARRGKGARVKRAAVDGWGTPQELGARRLSEDDDRLVREAVAEARTHLKAILGSSACSYDDIDADSQWVQERLRLRSRRWSLADALRMLKGIESHAEPFSPKEKRNAEVDEVLWLIRGARMRLLERYSLHPEYCELAERIRRVLIESGAVEDEHDWRIETVLRPLRELLGSVSEKVDVESAETVLASAMFLPDAATKGKLREQRTTAKDGSTMSTFEGDSCDWLEQFAAPMLRVRLNPDLLHLAEGDATAKPVQSEVPSDAP